MRHGLAGGYNESVNHDLTESSAKFKCRKVAKNLHSRKFDLHLYSYHNRDKSPTNGKAHACMMLFRAIDGHKRS
ncbi:hypothetical protein TYRP_020144 [Tyrophagus putrescentiae]|nr:hypothetical protein TYRP_020144 [Tyrophagus putrescentiae]